VIDSSSDISGAADNGGGVRATAIAQEAAAGEQLALMSAATDDLSSISGALRNLRSRSFMLNGYMMQLTELSDSVSEVLDAIVNITTQTRILAINSAIESARAGDAGNTFGVLAREIQGLAGQTADAATKISEFLDMMRSMTSTTVEACAETSASVESATRSTDQLKAHLNEATLLVAS
jgi:methyl-accepting chemotaxis protein